MILDKAIMNATFRLKCAAVKEFGNEYIKAKIMIDNYEYTKDFLKEDDEKYNFRMIRTQADLDYCKSYVHFIESILNNLDPSLAQGLKNDFFSKGQDNWWYVYYSKSSYYRLKKRAVDEFLTHVL